MPVLPIGYIELTNVFDGKRFALDARGLVVTPALGATRVGWKFAANCTIGSVSDPENFWSVVENYGEVMAKLAAALGSQQGGAS